MYENLRKIRNSSNIELSEILKLLGISKATYYRKENGKIKFSLEEAKKMSALFKKDIEDIFFDNEVEKNATA